MAGIFNIFNETENPVSLSSSKGKENPHHIPATLAAKQSNIKPKGLTIRSKSDLNISSTNSTPNKMKNSIKSPTKQFAFSKPSSPFKLKTPKSKSFSNLSAKRLSPKVSSPIMQNVVDDFVFTKPATPKKPLIRCNKPEKLAFPFDDYKFIMEEMESVMNEELMWLRSARESAKKLDDSVISLEDEGFISDLELNSTFETSTFETSTFMSPLPSACSIDLPDISDISDCED